MNDKHDPEICTPFAKIDVQKLINNIESFAKHFKKQGINLRPHIKTHKCAEIAAMQIESGACGITVATLNEAEAMARNGINDILIAYPVVGSAALSRLKSLKLDGINVISAFDSIFHLDQLKKITGKEAPAKIYLEINSGQNRCGIRPLIEEMMPIAHYLDENRQIFSLEGVFTHAGHVYRCENSEQIRQVAREEQQAVVEAAHFFRRHGFNCPMISTGTTPTAFYTDNTEVNECRPGNYVFYDAIQLANSTTTSESCALTIVSTVVAVYADRIIIDAGSKSLGLDRGAHGLSLVQGFGLITGYPDLVISALSEEHGIVKTTKANVKFPQPGDRIEIIPNHSCATVNMFSEYQIYRNTVRINSWPLIGRR